MKKIVLLPIFFSIVTLGLAQRPSKEQMEKDKKAYAAEQKKLNEKLANMDPKAKQAFDSLMNAMGAGSKMDEANQKINTHASSSQKTTAKIGLSPQKSKASIAATPTTAGMGSFIGTGNHTVFAAMLPAAKNKANEIYTSLQQKRANSDEMGNAATALWMSGRTQIALGLMAEVCSNDAGNTDNLNNYAAMLTMMGAPEMAIPILNNLNARFKQNSTILNNLGQAWFALGDIDKATRYLDSTLVLNAGHAQAHETKCLIAESKGNKTAAIAHAKAAFKQGNTPARRDKLKQLGYTIAAGDYNHFPTTNKSDDLLNLGGFLPMEFPKSYAAMKAYEKQRKIFVAEIDKQAKPLKKMAETANQTMLKQLEAQQKQFMNAMNKAKAKPGSVSQIEALAIMRVPIFSEKMNAKEKLVLENLQLKKNTILQKMAEFRNGEGAAYKNTYDASMRKINERWKNVGQAGSENNEVLCSESVKAVDTYLSAFNRKYEELYNEYLAVQKQFLNEMSYLTLYTTYPEAMPAVNAGLQLQWLNDLSFKAEVLAVTYGCSSEGKIKGGKLTAFKDPNCNINSEFNVGLKNFGGSIKLDCNGMTTNFNAAALGVTLHQDLDHAGFGDSFKNCTVSIGPKISAGGKVGPLEASVSAGAGVDIEMDRNGIADVVLTGGVEAEAGIGPASASAGAAASMSLNTGASSIQGTGIFK